MQIIKMYIWHKDTKVSFQKDKFSCIYTITKHKCLNCGKDTCNILLQNFCFANQVMLYSRITLVVPYIAAQTKLEIKSWLGSSINCNFNKGRPSKQEKTATYKFHELLCHYQVKFGVCCRYRNGRPQTQHMF